MSPARRANLRHVSVITMRMHCPTEPCLPAADHQRPRAAFTIVEVVIVVVIISIVASVAVPKFAKAISRQRSRAGAEKLVHDIQLVRQHARHTGSAQEILFDLDAQSYTLTGVQPLNRTTGTYVQNVAEEPYHGILAEAEFDADTKLRIDGYGMPTADGTVSLLVGNRLAVITVTAATGQVDITYEELDRSEIEAIKEALGLDGVAPGPALQAAKKDKKDKKEK
jgi:prepilin-type N-terminal cleavage/methylation domain-containing protein